MGVHDSQAYRKMDVTREHISHILDPRDILLSFSFSLPVLFAASLICVAPVPFDYMQIPIVNSSVAVSFSSYFEGSTAGQQDFVCKSGGW